VKVIVARDTPAAGQRIGNIRSWWISEENLTNPQLLLPSTGPSAAPPTSGN
jgi:hypothetical protein